MLPSILLSGFMFPRESMPPPICLISFAIPVTHFLEILGGIILRAAELRDLLSHVMALSVCCVAILSLSVMRFHKQLDRARVAGFAAIKPPYSCPVYHKSIAGASLRNTLPLQEL